MNTWDTLASASRNGDIAELEAALASGVPIDGAPAPVYNPEISAYTGNLTLLMYAAAAGQSATLAFLLDRGAAIDQWDGEGMTALHYAVQYKQSDAIKLLVNRGAALDRISMGGSILTMAARSLEADDIRFLLAHGSNANEPLADGKTPLIAAAENLRADLVRIFLDHGADPTKADPKGRTPFGIATRNRNPAVLLALQNPSEQDPQRALYNAAQCGDLSGIHAAMAKGAQVNALPEPNKNGGDATALMYASMGGQLAAASLLLDLGAQIDLGTEFGASALHCAISNSHLEVVKLLVERGRANLCLDAMYEGPPLSLAALRGSPEMIAYLIEHGAPIDAIRKWGNTALADAVVHNRIDAVRVLLSHGADANRKSAEGRSALEMAEQTGKFRIADSKAWKDLFKR
jgi:ankyrin repeat protein